MTKNEIILIADASGIAYYGMGKDRDKFLHYLEAFAALVSAAEREACAKLVDHILKEGGGTYADAIRATSSPAAQSEQEPSQWRDMIVATLVREGIDKHRARELADHFAAQQKQEPVAFYHPRNGFYWANPTSIFAPTSVDVEPLPLYASPPAAQPEPPSEWPLIKNILAEYGLDAIAFVAGWKAAQRPWQGLTEEEVQFYIKKHSKLVNAGYDKATDTNLVTKTFDNTGFYKEVSAVLKERNT